MGYITFPSPRTRFLSTGFDPIPNSEGNPVTAGTVAAACFAGLWSYDGWNNLNFVTEEVKNPSRNLPLAISIGIPFTAAIYILAFVSYLTILAPVEVINSEAVANDWATRLLFISVKQKYDLQGDNVGLIHTLDQPRIQSCCKIMIFDQLI